MVSVVVSRTLTVPDDRVAEARKDLDMLNNPRNLITYNDGYFSASLERKWRMSPHELAQVVKFTKAEFGNTNLGAILHLGSEMAVTIIHGYTVVYNPAKDAVDVYVNAGAGFNGKDRLCQFQVPAALGQDGARQCRPGWHLSARGHAGRQCRRPSL